MNERTTHSIAFGCFLICLSSHLSVAVMGFIPLLYFRKSSHTIHQRFDLGERIEGPMLGRNEVPESHVSSHDEILDGMREGEGKER